MLERFEHFSHGIFLLVKTWHRIAGEELSVYGLSSSHLSDLLALIRNPKGLTATEISELSGKDKSATSRSLNTILKKGLIEKEGMHRKGYGGTFHLTKEGRLVAEQIQQKISQAVTFANEGITEEKRIVFYEVFDQFIENITNIDGKKL